jgi:hypothetical protein
MKPVSAENVPSDRGGLEAARAGAWLQFRYNNAHSLGTKRKNCRGTLSEFNELQGPQFYTLYCYGMFPSGNNMRTAVILQINYRSGGPFEYPNASGGVEKHWASLHPSDSPTRITYRFPNRGDAKGEPALATLRSAIQKVYKKPTTDDVKSGGFWFVDDATGHRINVRTSERPTDGFIEYTATAVP